MNQNKIIAFFILFFAGIVFLLFSFLVWITRGKNRGLVSRKIRVGMSILAFTGFLSVLGCESCRTPPLCYVTVQMNAFEFTKLDEEYRVEVILNEGRTVHGNVFSRYGDKFIFKILDENNGVSGQGLVLSSDGSFDSPDEEILFEIPDTTGPGIYRLSIYAIDSEDQQTLVYSGYINIK